MTRNPAAEVPARSPVSRYAAGRGGFRVPPEVDGS